MNAEAVNIYCDESGHLEGQQQPVMVLGAVWCPEDRAGEIAAEIREIKVSHRLKSDFEVKWTKVSPGQLKFYLALIEYFFASDDLHFRALVVRQKDKLRHKAFQQDHETWYYKMYFELLSPLLSPEKAYYIYPDILDTRSAVRLKKLQEVLCNNIYDFKREIIQRIQPVRSHEVEQIQLADLLIGAVSYANRTNTSPAKSALVERVRQLSGYSLTKTTLLREDKVNIFCWRPRGE